MLEHCPLVALWLTLVAALAGCESSPYRDIGPRLPRTKPAEPFRHRLGMRFVALPVGHVTATYPGYPYIEQSRHEMRRCVLISACEITNKQYEAFVAAYRRKYAAYLAERKKPKPPGTNEQKPKRWLQEVLSHKRHPKAPGDNYPVCNVTGRAAEAFCEWLTEIDPLGRTYRLPKSGDWEYAARGGRDNLLYPWGNTIDKARACYAAKGPRPVGLYPPNRFGLYDVAGNVAEWVKTDGFPKYVLRGGSWKNDASGLQFTPFGRGPKEGEELDHHGFRVICEPPLLE